VGLGSASVVSVYEYNRLYYNVKCESEHSLFLFWKFDMDNNQVMNDMQYQKVVDECLPLLKSLAIGRYAISVGGSHGKGVSDNLSDIDFRLFCDDVVNAPNVYESEAWKAFSQVVDRWRSQGVYIDHCWVRKISDMELQLEAWIDGDPQPYPVVWTIWGYYLPTDLNNQIIIDDPDGIIASWQAKLTPYSLALKSAIIEKYMRSLNYWRSDYHYQNKVERGDVVFLSGMSSRLVQDIIQVLFALNETYYVGDGKNLDFLNSFAIKPDNFEQRINDILYPAPADDVFMTQYQAIMGLIDELVAMVASAR
jgi:hypothetical protein